jgi:5-hydroxyisourate hydrolase-like protein (transthyretin family)
MTIFKRFLALSAVLLLTACGGGGGGAPFGGTPPGGGGEGPGTPGAPPPTAADLVLVVSTASLPNDRSQTAVATATALDANRNTVAGVPVTISVNAGGIVTPSGATTSDAGVVTAEIGIGADTSNRTITVTAVSGGLTRTATLEVRDPVPGGEVGGPSLDVALSSSVITPAAPATATVVLRSASGDPLPGVTVALSTTRGNLATPAAASVLTNASGQATVQINANTTGLSGADDLLAVAGVGAAQVTGRAGFSVVGSSPTLAIAASSTTIRASTSPAPITATLRNAQGDPVSGQLVSFSSTAGRVSFEPATALTNGAGVATSAASPTNAAVSAADVLVVSATLAGQSLQSSLGVQLVGEEPSIALTVSNSNVSATQPATLQATVRDAAGALVQNAVVSFSSQFELAAFDATTASTGATGVASVVVSPSSPSTAGADVVQAAVTVAGITRVAEVALQFTGGLPTGTPVLTLDLSRTSISAATPATVTATLTDARGVPAAGQLVSFDVVRDLAQTNVETALTNDQGRAVVVLSPVDSSAAGADEITATARFGGTTLQATRAFQVQATDVTIDSFTAAQSPLSAYAQTTLSIGLTGASVSTPVNLSISSACAAQGKASLSPASIATTSNTVTLQYRDDGCGAVQAADQLQVVVDGTATTRTLTLPIAAPAANSIAFVEADPEQIFLRGSGFTESSVVTFEVRDSAGNPLPGRVVEMRLITGAGGVTMEGLGVNAPSPFTQTSNALGRVAARVNSGTVPTPVRIQAALAGTSVSTVSSNLSVAVGLPSQLNFSLSQGTRNIEGYNIDGTPNTYQIIAADRSGNPVPAGTSINFIAEGGQIEAVRQTQIVGGIARTTANFVSAEPRPVDGRVTITVYALGEESFIDLNGNNAYDPGEPFQDLGNIFKDRRFNGVFNADVDEFIALNISNSNACAAPGSPLLLLDASIPSVPGTCSGDWSGAGQVYVRRALETVLSTSPARPLWANTSGLSAQCTNNQIEMQVGTELNQLANFIAAGGNTWYGGAGTSGTLSFIVGDANPGRMSIGQRPRLNPMAAGTTITASTPTPGLAVSVAGGSPVPSTTEATGTAVIYNFTDPAVTSGVVLVNFVSPSGTGTTIVVPIERSPRPTACPL